MRRPAWAECPAARRAPSTRVNPPVRWGRIAGLPPRIAAEPEARARALLFPGEEDFGIVADAGGRVGNFTGEGDFLHRREVVAGSPKC